ncbi:MAG: toxin-antitoxin system YwqK family antitoxin [Micrococcales bacterium]
MSAGSPFYPSGLPRFKCENDEAGEMHGYWEFYRADGTLMRSGWFDHGRQSGEWKTFARDGRLVKSTRFD